MILAISAFVTLPDLAIGDMASEVVEASVPLVVMSPGVTVELSDEAITLAMPAVATFEISVDTSSDVLEADDVAGLIVTALGEAVLFNALLMTAEIAGVVDTGLVVVGDSDELEVDAKSTAVPVCTELLGESAETILDPTAVVADTALGTIVGSTGDESADEMLTDTV